MAAFPFLTASWRKLIMAQYEVSPAVLRSRLPTGLELDLYHGRCFVSLVGFLFDRVRLLGLPPPFHTRFAEVNLRFYVCRAMPDGSWRRGVVFVSEIVPKPAIVLLARSLYGEAYTTAPVRHLWGRAGAVPGLKPPKGGRFRARAHFRDLQRVPPSSAREAHPWHRRQCQIEYEWRVRGLWQRLGVRAENRLGPIAPGSME